MARRPVFGPVRKQIYDTTTTLERNAKLTLGQANKSLLEGTASVLKMIAKFTEVAVEILDGSELVGEVAIGNKVIPLKLKLKINLREEGDGE